MGETTYYRVQSRDQPRGWAFGFSLVAHVGIIGAMGLFLHAPLPSTNLPGPIKVELISIAAARGQKTTPPHIERESAQLPPVVKPKPLIKPRTAIKTRTSVVKQKKPVVAIKPVVIPEPETEIISSQGKEPLLSVETLLETDVVPEITDSIFVTEGGVPVPRSRKEARAETGINLVRAITVAANIIQKYANLIRERINKVKRYPLMARRAGKQGTVVVEFVINQKGELLDSRVINGCGTKALDRAALKALNRASPFAPLPKELKSPHTFNIQINFYLEG